MSPINTPNHEITMHTAPRPFRIRHLALCLPLLGMGLSFAACDVEDVEPGAADDESDSEDGGSGFEESEDDGSSSEEPEFDAPDEPCDGTECAPVRDPALDLTAEPDPAAGTACGGPTTHRHGPDLFPGSYQAILGCDCAPGQNRDYFSWYNVGNGSCSAIGWESPDPRDCRVRMQINRSGGFMTGNCYAVVEQSPAGSCYSARTNTGCDDPNITNCVCNQDSYCCYTQWDALCAWEVTSLGCG